MPDQIENLLGTVIRSFKDAENVTIEKIRERLISISQVLDYSLDDQTLESAVKTIDTKLVTTMSEGISLVDPDADHDDEWYRKRGDIEWNYWDDYKAQLESGNWSPQVVNTLGDVTEKILGLLKDPRELSDWDRRGLVIGHVQSGKTANYIGLVSKAADAGYKFIIVIAGIHNNLRKQTQIRIDEGFVGRDSTPDRKRKEVGVGVLNRNRKFPITLTTTDKDFTKQIANQLVADLQGFSQPVVVVIKKNVHMLHNLYNWLKEWNLKGSTDKIAEIPMLMIDDEADNASVNTKRSDLDPTRTNQEIRQILSLFRKSCYVGYTATPFANIFINPDSSDEMLDDDLFPRDFIYCLDAPTNYFGPGKVFLDEESSDRILCTINDAEDYIELSHRKDWAIPDLPPSMKQAVNSFVIGKAIRIRRGQERKHCSMMINASRFVDVQRQIREHVSYYLATMARGIRYSHALPEAQALKNEHMADLKKTYDEEFTNIAESWSEIQKASASAIDSIKTYLINSKSGEALDYKHYEENGESLTVIAVGGLSLSRGLTLEGLMVSYMYRNTKMYDTLMQMGRWFGYRDAFEDMCRVWLPDESQGWYSHIAEATEELRQQIKQMQRDRLTPRDFGLYVRAHPDALIVTALNKMRDAERRAFRINFSGELEETVIVPSDEKIAEKNRQVITDLFDKLSSSSPDKSEEIPGAYFWKDVGWENIEEFLIGFRFHKQIIAKRNAVLEYLRKIAKKYPNADVAFISLKDPKEATTRLQLGGKWDLLCQKRSVGTLRGGIEIRKPAEEDGFYITNKQRVASRGVEAVGLTDDQLRNAEAEAGDVKNISDRFYRTVRAKPLLMIHLLTLVQKNRETGEETLLLDMVPAMGISFPGRDYTETVEYVVNKIWLQQDMFDDPDEEDDYDN